MRYCGKLTLYDWFQVSLYADLSLSIALEVGEAGRCLEEPDGWLFASIKTLSLECGKVTYKDNRGISQLFLSLLLLVLGIFLVREIN